jgi:inhibitor of cysteine peptidase
MQRNIRRARLLPAWLLAAACLWSSAPSPGAPQQASPAKFVAVEQKQSNSMVAIARGATLVLRLRSNPTTGYSWQIAGIDGKRLQPIGKPTYVRPASALPGAGGYQEFRFQALADGMTTVTLNYARPFEKNAAPGRTYSLKLNIGTFGVLAHQIIIVTDADQSGVVTLDKGTLLTVSLPANPTTGYNWKVGGGSSQRLQSLNQPVYIPPASALLGAGGYLELLFEAESPGAATLVLNYARPFERNARPARTFRLTATIHG